MVNLASFWQTEATFQTVLPDRQLLIEQKMLESAKIEKLKCDILGDFQTLWAELSSQESLWCCPNGSLACQPWFLRDFLTQEYCKAQTVDLWIIFVFFKILKNLIILVF